MKVSVLYSAGNFLTMWSKISSEEGVCTYNEKCREALVCLHCRCPYENSSTSLASMQLYSLNPNCLSARTGVTIIELNQPIQCHLKATEMVPLDYIIKNWNMNCYRNSFHSLTYLLTYSLTYLLAYLLPHSLTYLFTHSLTHSLNQSLTHSITHSLTHSLTHTLTHSLTHSLTY